MNHHSCFLSEYDSETSEIRRQQCSKLGCSADEKLPIRRTRYKLLEEINKDKIVFN
jgi:hypothetical protein